MTTADFSELEGDSAVYVVESRDVADRNAARRVDDEVLDKVWAGGNAV